MNVLNDVLNAVNQKRGNNREENKLLLPQYDKSKFDGEGDRCATRLELDVPIDIIILEGWFIGFEAVLQGKDNDDLLKGDMVDVNAKLFMYGDLMWKNPEINSLGIVLCADTIQNVYTWRTQQEHDLISKTGKGMTDEEVKSFVDRYFPCYQLYYENLVRGEKLGSIATLTLGIDIERKVYSSKVRCIE